MTRIAVSGHRGLSTQVEALIDKGVRIELSRFDSASLVGISCLADGADQIFARAVLDLGAVLEVLVPAHEYREGLPADAQPAYDQLLRRAARIEQLDHRKSTSMAHMDASVQMLRNADILLAVWDGKPARALGGTGDVVAHARSIGVPVTVIWPEGSRRH